MPLQLFGGVYLTVMFFFGQPERLRDDEVTELEQQLQNQALGRPSQPPCLTPEAPAVPSDCFQFQRRVFGELVLT